jgi:hypothetical protein
MPNEEAEKEVIRNRKERAEPAAAAGIIFRILRIWSGPGR